MGKETKILGFIRLVSLEKISKDSVDKVLFLKLKLLKGLETYISMEGCILLGYKKV